MLDRFVDERLEWLVCEVSTFVASGAVLLESCETVEETEIGKMSFKVLALNGAIADFLCEKPEGKISEVFLGNFDDIYGVKSVGKVFLGSFVFLN